MSSQLLRSLSRLLERERERESAHEREGVSDGAMERENEKDAARAARVSASLQAGHRAAREGKDETSLLEGAQEIVTAAPYPPPIPSAPVTATAVCRNRPNPLFSSPSPFIGRLLCQSQPRGGPKSKGALMSESHGFWCGHASAAERQSYAGQLLLKQQWTA
ncbi:hypothetical protein Q8A67_025500 [Cirrhinus molitorella]|uniref:Uncharacterized protein n=1 Tax=Cirrhinus molitorella TaxID=172907 RepID=A0AA88NZT9_9TELE|nr:hypothetical protein Q8A67_025500 [Cirrhinus molitorella]